MSTIETVTIVKDTDLELFFRAMGFASRIDCEGDDWYAVNTHWQIPGAAFEVTIDSTSDSFSNILYAMEVLSQQLGLTLAELREHIIDVARAVRAARAAVWGPFFATVAL